jgi:archaellum biogenesis ATPase FlaH
MEINIEKIFLSRLITVENPISYMHNMTSDMFYNSECSNIFNFLKEKEGASKDLIFQAAIEDQIELSLAQEIIEYLNEDGAEGGLPYWKSQIVARHNKMIMSKGLSMIHDNMDIDDICGVIETVKKSIITSDKKRVAKSFGELLPLLDEAEASKYSTGYEDLDKPLKGGYEKGRLYVVAARPGVGKTTMLENLAYNAAVTGLKTCFITLEMTCAQVVRDFTRRACVGKSTMKFDHRELIKGKEHKALQDNLTIAPDCNEVASISHAGKESDIILVDQLSFLKTRSKTESRALEVSAIVHELKTYALRENKIVCLAVQINRSGDSSHGATPQLINLKESGGIEEAADVCLLMHKDELDLTLNVNVAKNRQGYTTTFCMNADYANKCFMPVSTPERMAPNHEPYNLAKDKDWL